MKKTIFVLLCLINFFCFSQNQKVNIKPINDFNKSIKTNKFSINDIFKYGNKVEENQSQIEFIIKKEDGSSFSIDYNRMVQILKKDVVEYFNLLKKYNSNLKKSVFQKTEEYNNYLKELNVIRSQILNSYFYFIIYIGKNNYNLENKSFEIETSVYKDWFYNSSYLQFQDFCILKPNYFNFKDYIHNSESKYLTQRILAKVLDEKLALKIDENCENTRLMLVFKLYDVFSRRLFVPKVGMNLIIDNIRTNQVEKALIYNSANYEIYKLYEPIKSYKK